MQQPAVYAMLALREHEENDRRHGHEHRDRRYERRALEVVVDAMNYDSDSKTRQQHDGIDDGTAFGEPLPHDSEDRGRAPMHDRGAEAADDPYSHVGAGRKFVQV